MMKKNVLICTEKHIYHVSMSLHFSYQLKMSESEIPLHITDTSTYPNASKWTTEEVVDYFTDLGFSNEAKAFKDQVISENLFHI